VSVVRILRLAVNALVVAVLVASGVYVIVYLARWEWNRAIVSGLFFLASLVLASTLLVLRSIRRLERRLDRVERTRSIVADENARRASRHFDWLREPPDNLGVFIPVLLGAGVLLSFAAYVLERLAGAVAGPTLDARTARLVEPDLALGGGRPDEIAAPVARRHGPRRVAALVAVVAAAAAIGLAVDAIGDVTQSRPEVPLLPGTASIELEIAQRSDTRSSEDVAATLWVACRNWLPPGVDLVDVVGSGPDRATIVLDHRLGEIHELRFTGCLQDLTVNSIRAEVESVVMSAPGGAAVGSD
jgi:hypothetical protein